MTTADRLFASAHHFRSLTHLTLTFDPAAVQWGEGLPLFTLLRQITAADRPLFADLAGVIRAVAPLRGSLQTLHVAVAFPVLRTPLRWAYHAAQRRLIEQWLLEVRITFHYHYYGLALAGGAVWRWWMMLAE